jgi:hypothetical protein
MKTYYSQARKHNPRRGIENNSRFFAKNINSRTVGENENMIVYISLNPFRTYENIDN